MNDSVIDRVLLWMVSGLTGADLESAWEAGAHGVSMMRGAWSLELTDTPAGI